MVWLPVPSVAVMTMALVVALVVVVLLLLLLSLVTMMMLVVAVVVGRMMIPLLLQPAVAVEGRGMIAAMML